MAYETLRKRGIKPIKVIVELEMVQINENGTFCRFQVVKATTSNKEAGLDVIAPPKGGGAIYIKAKNREAIVYDDGPETAKAGPKKFF